MAREKAENIRATIRVAEAAVIAGVGHKTIRDGIAAGYIPHLWLGRCLLIPKGPFLRWIDNAGRTTTAK